METLETQVLPKIESKPHTGKKFYIDTIFC